MPQNIFHEKVTDLLANAEKYHLAYYDAKTFGGPSLYFHRQALANGSASDYGRRLEYVYATLAAWGMHRMGKGGSKMVEFETFYQSMMSLKPEVEALAESNGMQLTDETWRGLEDVFMRMKIMASGTSIVGNSKVLAHLCPNLVAPVDREYTLRYLRGHTNITNNKESEWLLFKEILCHFFMPVYQDATFRCTAEKWLSNQGLYPWDTSHLKIIDNLVIGARKWSQGLKTPKSEPER